MVVTIQLPDFLSVQVTLVIRHVLTNRFPDLSDYQMPIVFFIWL